MATLDRESKQLINKARTLGGAGLPVSLSDNVLLRLAAVAAIDLGRAGLVADIISPSAVGGSYYQLGLSWFSEPVPNAPSFEQKFMELKDQIADYATYFKCLCELHKRRLKYQLILEHQAFPQLEQIVPRGLLEYGLIHPSTLAYWLIWRKWLFDLDNRAAQETGYLFEPILAAALGGVSYSPKKSPIRRVGNTGQGRQVDCIEDSVAYEFKMRVTIAASGQGRFQEELDFARDCQASGYKPVLLVLDPTPSTRLDELAAEYAKFGGTAFIGPNAWAYLEERAGPTMGKFVQKYVREPLSHVESSYEVLPAIELTPREKSILVRIGSETLEIARAGDQYDFGDDGGGDTAGDEEG